MTRRVSLSRRGRGSVVAIVLVGAGSFLLGSTVSAASVGAGQGADHTGTAGDTVIVCESGVVDHGGGVETSSAVAYRVSTGEGVQPPSGGMACRDG